MPLVTTEEMFKKAMEGNYAIGAFNFNNMEFIQAICDAAEAQKSPVILQCSSSAIKYARIPYLMKMVEAAVESTTVPIALHLDHGPDFETAKMCIDAGFTSVMIDASKYDYDENVRITKEVVDYAHAHGVVVEAEIGTLAGVEDEVSVEGDDAKYTNPQQAYDFVQATGVDSLAIAIGTSHGAYKFKGEPRLRFDILEQVKQKLPNTPIVLHGASTVIQEYVQMCNENGGNIPGAQGCPDEMLAEASHRGVSKVNVDTDLRLAMTGAIRRAFAQDPSVFDPRKYMGPGRDEIQKAVEHKMRDVFGSSNKA